MSETVSWFEAARAAAAGEFGRRMWRWFVAFGVLKWVLRRVAPTALIVGALALAVWTAVRWSAWWLPRLTVLAVVAAGLGVALWGWQRWRWAVRAGFARPATALAAVVLLGVVGASVVWLR